MTVVFQLTQLLPEVVAKIISSTCLCDKKYPSKYMWRNINNIDVLDIQHTVGNVRKTKLFFNQHQIW